MRQATAEQFLKDVANHQMTTSHESGVYRHLRFQIPLDSNMWFDLVTWPGFLTIAGDMGTWTFARVPDMFTFFRSKELHINPSYWSEKIQGGVHGGSDTAKVYDFETFASRLMDQLQNYYSLEGDDLAAVQQAVKDEILCSEDRYESIAAFRDFSHTLEDGRKFEFDSFEIPDGKDYAYHFIWCLYAIVWGIQQYDAAAAAKENT